MPNNWRAILIQIKNTQTAKCPFHARTMRHGNVVTRETTRVATPIRQERIRAHAADTVIHLFFLFYLCFISVPPKRDVLCASARVTHFDSKLLLVLCNATSFSSAGKRNNVASKINDVTFGNSPRGEKIFGELIRSRKETLFFLFFFFFFFFFENSGLW